MEHQQKFNFSDDQSPAQQHNIDEDQLQRLIEMMGNIIFHVFHAQQRETDEQSYKSHQD